jgi:hypothetical protein
MPSSVPGTLVRLGAQHATKPLSVFARSHMLLMVPKKGFNQPTAPVWGSQFLYSPVIVEELKAGSNVPNWKNYLGFGHQFLLNASQTVDGMLYFCVGFSVSSTCQRIRHAIVYLTLDPDAEERLTWLHHDSVKVQRLMADIQKYPLRRFTLGSLIPGMIVPRVVGTILEADESTQLGFFKAVESLFKAGGQLPSEYTHESKAQVHLFSFLFS